MPQKKRKKLILTLKVEGQSSCYIISALLRPFPGNQLQWRAWFKLRESHPPEVWVLYSGVDDMLGYKSWLKGVWGYPGTFQQLHDTVKSRVMTTASCSELASWMTSACHHWGRSTAGHRLWFTPLSFVREAQLIREKEQATCSCQRGQSCCPCVNSPMVNRQQWDS